MNGNNKNNYPIFTVIIAYTLLIGILDGLLLLPFVALLITSTNDLNYIGIYFWLWFLLSLLPASVIGACIGYFKIIITEAFDYLKPMGIGFLVFFGFSLIYALSQMVIDKRLLELESIFYIIIVIFLISLLSGISSAILAKFILPKS